MFFQVTQKLKLHNYALPLTHAYTHVMHELHIYVGLYTVMNNYCLLVLL